MGPSTQQFFFSSSDVIVKCFGHTTIIKRRTVVCYLKLFAWLQELLAGYVIRNCGYRGDASCCVCIINKAIMGPLTQQFFSASDVIATTCFEHTIIIRRYTVVYCLKQFDWL
jgi:hypothetical protein